MNTWLFRKVINVQVHITVKSYSAVSKFKVSYSRVQTNVILGMLCFVGKFDGVFKSIVVEIIFHFLFCLLIQMKK